MYFTSERERSLKKPFKNFKYFKIGEGNIIAATILVRYGSLNLVKQTLKHYSKQ